MYALQMFLSIYIWTMTFTFTFFILGSVWVYGFCKVLSMEGTLAIEDGEDNQSYFQQRQQIVYAYIKSDEGELNGQNLEKVIQWSAKIRTTSSDFGQITLVQEQLMFECNYVRKPNDFIRLLDENFCRKLEPYLFERSVFGQIH